MLRLANGCNIELFQTQPDFGNPQANIAQPGIHHFSVYVDDINLAGERMREYGVKTLRLFFLRRRRGKPDMVRYDTLRSAD